MGIRGTKPHPVALQLISGMQQSRLRTDEPQVERDLTEAPSWMTGEERRLRAADFEPVERHECDGD